MVDALGGVAMYYPRPVRDSNNGHNESGRNGPRTGCQRLGGSQALALARSRYLQYQDRGGQWHSDPGTDLGRIRRQQTMLRALATKDLSRNLANPIRANALVRSVVRSLTKDDDLTIGRSVTLARQFRSFDPSRLTTLTLPVDRAVQRDGVLHRDGQPGFDAGLKAGWEQVLLLRQPDAKATVAKFLSRPARSAPAATVPDEPGRSPSPAPAKISVTVQNATPRQGLAASVTTQLRARGFDATNGGNAPPSATTNLTHAEGTDAAASTAARTVKAGRGQVAMASQPGLAPNTVVLVLGDDFQRVTGRPTATKPRTARPPQPTPATRDLPPWDPRPC